MRKPVLIYSDKNLQAVVREMRDWAQSHNTIAAPPVYSPSERVATERALADPEDAVRDMWTVLFLPMRIPVTMALSIDTYGDNAVWHLSMSGPNLKARRPDRVPDMFANRITRAFFADLEVIEGPPEGAFKKVRHFRAPGPGA